MDFDFCVYILSYERANDIKTLDILKKYNYNGHYYVVCSEDDPQIRQYKKTIRADNLLVFNKYDYISTFDTFISSDKNKTMLKSASYARNFILNHARNNNIKTFCMMDDDIQKIRFRYVDCNGKFRAKEIQNITEIFRAMSDFVLSSQRISCLSIALSSGYFGGVNGTYKKGMTRWCFQIYVINTNTCRNFDSIMYEDRIYAIKNFDLLNFCYYGLDFESPQMGSTQGGVDYQSITNRGQYLKICSGPKVDLLADNKVIYHQNIIFPKIISQRYKK